LRRALIFGGVIVVAVALASVIVFIYEIQNAGPDGSAVSLPIIHSPTFLGEYPYILGSGNVVQNGSAYSYVRINASAIRYGDSFTVFPAINVPLWGIDEGNFTTTIIYRGSSFGSSLFWLNFSAVLSIFDFSANTSQSGISANFTRSAFLLPVSQKGAEFFSQISNVVNSNDEFEYFFYIGNSSIPSPQLSHGPVH
jgi:hypothetical protein